MPSESGSVKMAAQRPPAVSDVHILWITAGLSCDGDSVSITAASQPSIEDVLLGAIPGLPKVHLHNRVLDYSLGGEEYLKVWNALFAGEPGQPGQPVDFDGDFVTLRGAQLSPRPVAGRIPVVIGGGGARLTMPLVAAYADWWNCPGYAFHRFDELRPLAGRARISTQHPVGLAATAADVPAVTAVAERRFGSWGGLITGTAADVAGALADLQARGVERFYLQFSDFGTPDTLARFGADVIPAVTGRR